MNLAYEMIRPGDRVTINAYAGLGREGPEYKPRSGRAVMLGPAGWVLNMGGPHGTPGIATPENTLEVRKSKKSKPAPWGIG